MRRLAHLRKTRTAPGERFALLDFDQAERDPQRAERALRMAIENDIFIVWQRPCLEAVLSHYLEGKTDDRPPDTPGR